MSEPERYGVPLTDEMREDLTRPIDAMSHQRYSEIKALEEEGRVGEVEEAEQREYREFDRAMQESRDTFEKALNPSFMKSYRPPSHAPLLNLKYVNPNAGVQDRLDEAIAEMAEQKHIASRSAAHLELMTKALDEMRADRKSADKRAALQAEANADQAKLNQRFSIVALVLAFAGVAVPFIIESIKGWQ